MGACASILGNRLIIKGTSFLGGGGWLLYKGTQNPAPLGLPSIPQEAISKEAPKMERLQQSIGRGRGIAKVWQDRGMATGDIPGLGAWDPSRWTTTRARWRVVLRRMLDSMALHAQAAVSAREVEVHTCIYIYIYIIIYYNMCKDIYLQLSLSLSHL